MAPSTIRGVPSFETTPPARPPAYVQGVYWVLTGIWPLLHRRSFEWATGPKVDYWLVELVGVFLAVIGVVMIVGRARDRISAEIGILAIGSTLALIAISVVYASLERIASIYFADAALEAMFLAGWVRWAVWRPRHRVVSAPLAVTEDVTPSSRL